MLIPLFSSAFLIMLASLIGVIFIWKRLGNFLQKNTHYLISFASGVFVVLTYGLLKETFHLSSSPLVAIASIILGILIIQVIIKLLPTSKHHHHSVPAGCNKKHSKIDARRVMWSDTFHNAGDGILIASSFLIDVHLGLMATIGIFLHEIVQEISEFFILKEAGYSTKKALFWNFLSSSSILLGIIVTLFFSGIEWMATPLMGFATGGFIYVLARDLFPHTFKHAKKTHSFFNHLIIFIFGIILMISVNALFPHSHEHHHHENGNGANHSKIKFNY